MTIPIRPEPRPAVPADWFRRMPQGGTVFTDPRPSTEDTAMQFIKFTERNDWEGETWRFYLQVDGNEEQITKLRRLLAGYNVKPAISYTLDDKPLDEATVDALVDNSDEGYMPAHNKVVGRFACPDDLGERANELYKGSIEEFFTQVEASDV